MERKKKLTDKPMLSTCFVSKSKQHKIVMTKTNPPLPPQYAAMGGALTQFLPHILDDDKLSDVNYKTEAAFKVMKASYERMDDMTLTKIKKLKLAGIKLIDVMKFVG